MEMPSPPPRNLHAEAHLLLATQKLFYYKSLIDMAKVVLKQTFTVDRELKPLSHIS